MCAYLMFQIISCTILYKSKIEKQLVADILLILIDLKSSYLYLLIGCGMLTKHGLIQNTWLQYLICIIENKLYF